MVMAVTKIGWYLTTLYLSFYTCQMDILPSHLFRNTSLSKISNSQIKQAENANAGINMKVSAPNENYQL